MKKQFFFAAVAIVALASCADKEYVGDSPTPNSGNGTSDAIVFNSGANSITRAGNHVGADAAKLLNYKFIVGGFKGEFKGDGSSGDGSNMTEVFDNYIVTWSENTAGITQSNTSDWEYVGVTAAAPSAITGAQTIKYWDFSTSQYDFAAYSTGSKTAVTGTPSSGQVQVTEITKGAGAYAGPTYTLTGHKNDLKECYVSDMVTVYNADYKNEVSLTFRSLSSKVRIALYETIPGYSVSDVEFYHNNTDGLDTDIDGNTDATLFIPATTGDANNFYQKGTYTITFPTIGSSKKNTTTYPNYNKASLSFTADDSEGSTSKEQTFGGLQYVTKHDREDNSVEDPTAEPPTTALKAYLGITSKTASFAGTAEPYYVTVLPNETGAVLELRVNYTLVSTDGSGETIKVYGAKAFVPQIYAQWKSGYAYTYIFKISDNTNGWTTKLGTDGDNKEGLYPITFDAVVQETEEHTQSTITTVATPSITTYQKGHNSLTDGPEYEPSSSVEDSIYVQVMKNSDLATDLDTKGYLYTVTGTGTATEADVMDALNIRTSGSAATVVGRNGWTLTPVTSPTFVIADGGSTFGRIPAADGNYISVSTKTAARFYGATGTYAFVYDTGTDNADSYVYSAQNFAKGAGAPEGWDASDASKMEWYEDPNGDTKCTGTWDSSAFDATDGKTYYRIFTNQNKVYGVKIIKVQ